MNPNELGLYIHIPFCKAKCYYCDFNSFAGMEELIPQYFSALNEELALYSGRVQEFNIKTIYIGGGTPSSVHPLYINAVMNSCRRYFSINSDCEITIEANPGTLTGGKLAMYRTMGINRLSIGMQAWQNSMLKSIGRIHTREEFEENFRNAGKEGFQNINCDLIFGLPGQQMQDWQETLEEVSKLGVEHISCYSLKVEEGTRFHRDFEEGNLRLPDEDLERDMYYHTMDKLSKRKYRHYEISNFCRDGFESRHNLIYWTGGSYIGMGAGAHSFYEDNRYNNIYDVSAYIKILKEGKRIPAENLCFIDRNGKMKEFMLLGLRLVDGVCLKEFKDRYGVCLDEVFGEKINRLISGKLLIEGDGALKLTAKGLDLANEVFMEFV